jgi:hypothetical protein
MAKLEYERCLKNSKQNPVNPWIGRDPREARVLSEKMDGAVYV